jgi:large subunit ribosomal protein L25
MSEVLTLNVEPRDPKKNQGTGTRVSRRLRGAGRVPAIVYGHKQTPQPISLTADDARHLIAKAAHLAKLRMGDAVEQVLLRDVQWDHLGREIVHLDFVRVSADESVETEVKLDYHGTPVGLGEGGQLEIIAHSLPIQCRADAIPDSIRVEIGELHANQAIHLRDLALPAGVTSEMDPETLLVHVVIRTQAEETTPAEGEGPAEPEVIGRKAEEKKED